MQRFWLALLLFLSSPAFSAGVGTITYIHAFSALSAGVNHTSAAIDTGLDNSASVQCDWSGLTGSINATVQLNSSSDGGIKWIPKTDASFTLSGATGAQLISLNQIVTEQFYQIVYTAGTTSGGTLDCWFLGKP